MPSAWPIAPRPEFVNTIVHKRRACAFNQSNLAENFEPLPTLLIALSCKGNGRGCYQQWNGRTMINSDHGDSLGSRRFTWPSMATPFLEKGLSQIR
jgi:hypothetical protein